MKQTSGGVSVDRGHRMIQAGDEPRTESRSGPTPDEADDTLGVWGDATWNLPGMGESGGRCGEWYPDGVCEVGHLDLGTHHCGNRSCSRCWGIWARDAAIRATVRVQAFRYQNPDDWHRQAAHGVVSPPDGEVKNERQYWEGRSRAAEMAKEKGWRGFAVIPHPFRVTDGGKQRYRAEVDGADEPGREAEYGVWVWLRNEVENWREYVYWSPHYHIIGATGADMDPGDEDDEWVYEFLRSFESFDGTRDSESHEDLYGAFRYLLSHTGWPEGSTKQVTTWYGDLANSIFVEDATEEWQTQKPSEGVLSVLEREVGEVAGKEPEEDDEGGNGLDLDRRKCQHEDCDEIVIDVFDVDQYLRQANPPPDVRERMVTARDWRLGRVRPPPGLRRPQTEEEARETFAELV